MSLYVDIIIILFQLITQIYAPFKIIQSLSHLLKTFVRSESDKIEQNASLLVSDVAFIEKWVTAHMAVLLRKLHKTSGLAQIL